MIPIPTLRQVAYAAVGAIILELLLALVVTNHVLAVRTRDRDAWHAARDRLELDYRTAQATAEATARATEARNAQITKDREHALQTELASVQGDARRIAANLAARLRSAARADQGSRGGVPAPASAASEPDGAGAEAELAADVAACSAAVVKAEGWQDFWRAIQPAE